MRIKIVFVLLYSILFFACSKDKMIDTASGWKGLELPKHFPTPIHNNADNPITQDGFALGKILFYDPALSRNNTINCGSCHIQTSAFTHHGHSLSHGIEDKVGRRNTPALQNMIWQKNFFWDGGVHNIELIPLNAIKNTVEMDESVDNILVKLKASKTYPALFKKAFGTEEITSTRMLLAMKQFMAMLVSANSKYDQYKLGKIQLAPDELAGLTIFQNKCSSCHSGELFTDNSFRNNGISDSISFDTGRMEISFYPADKYKFKVPSLRNVEKTKPYMHNGSIGTIDNVLEFYNSGVNQSANLDPLLTQNNTRGIPLSADEKMKLKAFLLTLTDDEFIRNPLFQPF
jgi:cytochrome c peroxidase